MHLVPIHRLPWLLPLCGSIAYVFDGLTRFCPRRHSGGIGIGRGGMWCCRYRWTPKSRPLFGRFHGCAGQSNGKSSPWTRHGQNGRCNIGPWNRFIGHGIPTHCGTYYDK